jgi:hypothetical protein
VKAFFALETKLPCLQQENYNTSRSCLEIEERMVGKKTFLKFVPLLALLHEISQISAANLSGRSTFYWAF